MASRDRALSAKAKEKLGITEAWEVSLAAKQLNGSNEHDGVDTSQAQFEADFQLVDEGVTALAQKTDFLKKARLEHVSDWSSAKAMHLLGLRPSSAKLQAWLGFETEEVLLEEIESEMRRVRDLDPTELEDHAPEKAVSILTDSGRPKRKKSVKESVRREHFASRDPKAIEVMGHDPSETKVMAVLGLDLDGLEAARNEVGETYTLSARTERERRTGINNIRKNKKALAFLGVDPSFRKKMQQLGLNEEELRQEELALQVARLEREYKRRVAQAYARNKRDSSKALATLGYDPSRQKVMYLLGFDPHDEAKLFGDLESATQEPVMSLGWRWMLAFLDTLREDEDEDMHDQAAEGSRADADEKKLRRRSINRTEARKALAVLGVDPSQQKLMDQLGLDETELHAAQREAVQLWEASITAARERDCCRELRRNKRSLLKAQEVLGHNFSQSKVMERLGLVDNSSSIEINDFEMEWRRNHPEGSPRPRRTEASSVSRRRFNVTTAAGPNNASCPAVLQHTDAPATLRTDDPL